MAQREPQGSMEELGDQLRQCIVAMSDATRGLILMELARAGELTPTQIAARLDLPANNVYHHVRVLRRLGVLKPPRVVPRDTYVEKYYRLEPELRAVLRQDPEWIDRTQATMTAGERKTLAISMCLAMIHLLRQAIRRYEAMDAEFFDRIAFQQQLGMASILRVRRPELEHYLAALRAVVTREDSSSRAEDDDLPPTDVVLITALPMVWDEVGERRE
jgi:DNA-binding transcriptional ArsR family regulator